MTDHTKGIRNVLLILLIIAVFIVLRELSGLLLPLTLAGLLTILNLPLVNFLSGRRVPKILVTLVVAVLSLAILWGVFGMIGGAVEQLIEKQDFLARQFVKKMDAAVTWIGSTVPGLNVDYVRQQLNQVFSPESIGSLIGTLLGAMGSFGSSTVLFLVYYLILLSGSTRYHAYVDFVVGDGQDGKGGETREIWEITQKSISAYMGIKTLISLATGIVAGLICWAFGLQFALFWGFMAFLLNYIPSIGSLVATALPVFMAVIQFDRVGPILALGLLLGGTQFVIGSLLDPMIMGNRLRLNTVTVIFGLLFWGYIWGIPGMLLSVPLMVTIRLLLERSDEFTILARVMGNPARPGRRKPALFSRIVGKKSEKG